MNILLSQSFLEFSGTVIVGLLIYLTLLFVKQYWVNTITYFNTFLLLPATTYVVTKVISDNLLITLPLSWIEPVPLLIYVIIKIFDDGTV